MALTLTEEEYLAHYGILRRSGRYPWGSAGNTQYDTNSAFLATMKELRDSGMSEPEIAASFGLNTSEIRAAKSIARNEKRAADIAMAQRLKDKGYSNVAIGERMEINESSVRSLLAPGAKTKATAITNTSDMLTKAVDEKQYIDIGSGVEQSLGVSRTKLNNAVAMAKEKGYKVYYHKVDQLGTSNQTTMKVLGPPDSTYGDLVKNQDKITQVLEYTNDGGENWLSIQPPVSVSSKRVAVTYAEDGGADADGVIYVRPGVDDISLGKSGYAQVRIAVDGTHYLKGMAMYKSDLPDGVDLQFNTNKSKTEVKSDLDAMKILKDDADNPFGATINRQSGVMNIINEEGDWGSWSKNLSSQFLSKQSPVLAKKQLDMKLEQKKSDLDEILQLTNPAVKRKLLEAYADGVDSAAVDLKAAGLPRQSTHVILPVNSLKSNEIYAPNFNDGERVVLVRYPHGGIFEIPELVVNNKHREARGLLGKQSRDAVGINARVAERLSGADFDGDTVLVIPNNDGKVRTSPALKGLKDFDPKVTYKGYEGMRPMSSRTKQREMGDVSNLITDMTIKGATQDEIARAVRHSMTVIDAEKHNLNYKQSSIDNGISALKQKYQGGERKGASTLISRASGEVRIPTRKPRPASEGGPIDKATGKKVFVPTGESYVNNKGVTITRKEKVKRLSVIDDANKLSSGTLPEKVYADYSNQMKALANQARREQVRVKDTPYSASAKEAYSSEVDSLNSKLQLAIANRPRERSAQILGNSIVTAKRQSNPDMTSDEVKRLKAQALQEARLRVGSKPRSERVIDITPSEWDAIQSGAIRQTRVKEILDNTDLDQVKQLATPRTNTVMSPLKVQRAKNMAQLGYTQAEIAGALGVSATSVSTTLSDGE